jgi:hypothetical protein
MRSNISKILQRLPGNLARNGTQVQVSWQEWPADAVVDPVTQTKVLADGQSPVARSKVVPAFLHFPEPGANSAVRQFNEVELGDCIADFHQDVALDRLDKLEFLFLDRDGQPVDGQAWVVKQTGDVLARTWGAVVQGQRIFRSVLLRKAT